MIARIVALGLMSAAAAVSQAAPSANADVPSIRVHYEDLDLSTEEGALRLYQRIAGAAKQVCPAQNPLDLSGLAVARRCISTAMARAVAEVNNPQLAKLTAQRGRRSTQG